MFFSLKNYILPSLYTTHVWFSHKIIEYARLPKGSVLKNSLSLALRIAQARICFKYIPAGFLNATHMEVFAVSLKKVGC